MIGAGSAPVLLPVAGHRLAGHETHIGASPSSAEAVLIDGRDHHPIILPNRRARTTAPGV